MAVPDHSAALAVAALPPPRDQTEALELTDLQAAEAAVEMVAALLEGEVVEAEVMLLAPTPLQTPEAEGAVLIAEFLLYQEALAGLVLYVSGGLNKELTCNTHS